MNIEILKKAVLLAKDIGHVFVATADAKGLPHVAAAGKISLISDEGRIAVEAWFCPGTVANLRANPHTALVIWNPNADSGYQLLGETEKIEDTAIMNGYAPGLEDKPTLPQVERRLLIRVDKIIGFSRSPHTDEEE
jgi:predicted pyridoxine 5'-phosphate oxidase superfamily flavin-nucleotide-binding protein